MQPWTKAITCDKACFTPYFPNKTVQKSIFFLPISNKTASKTGIVGVSKCFFVKLLMLKVMNYGF